MHPLAEVRGDVDQRIDARLSDAAMLGRFKLRPAVLLNQRFV